MPTDTLTGAAHVIQMGLTPIFMLTGLGTILNVFSTRLARISDRGYRLSHDIQGNQGELACLRMRSRILDTAVLFAALAGALTCLSALTMFVGALQNTDAGKVLYLVFGAALVCAILALASFSAETIISGRTVRAEARAGGGRDRP